MTSKIDSSIVNSFSKTVRERDLDHFLMEELQASPDFRAWFIGHLDGRFDLCLLYTSPSPRD